LTGGTRKQKEKKIFFLKWKQKSNVIKKNWVLVFSFMYLVSADPMDTANVFEKICISECIFFSVEIKKNKENCCLGPSNRSNQKIEPQLNS
jgi:hypothetical protein